MRCTYLGCDRKVGWRRYCEAHRVWVAYLRRLKHQHCGPSCPHRPK